VRRPRTYLDEVVSLRPRKRLSPRAFRALALFGSEIPYGRVARVLFRHRDQGVSATTTMGTLCETGDLLKAQAARQREDLFVNGLLPDAGRECAEIRVEADGVWVARQGAKGRGIEIKALVAYEGKHAGHRVEVVHHALDGAPKRFWEEGVARMADRYSLAALKRCYAGSDGAKWCGALADYLHGPTVIHKLDPWHVNRAIKAACQDPRDAAPLFALLHEGHIDDLLGELRARAAADPKAEPRMGALGAYITANRRSIEADAPDMGTMEGTNAHLYAARMKVWGGAWSAAGANDMARIRAALSSGDTLPVPRREQAFKDKDRTRRAAILEKRRYGFGYEMVRSDGKGYEPPSGHLMPFSTKRQFLAMFNPLN